MHFYQFQRLSVYSRCSCLIYDGVLCCCCQINWSYSCKEKRRQFLKKLKTPVRILC